MRVLRRAGGLPKKTQTYIFFQIVDGKKFVQDLKELIPLIKTVEQVLKDRDDIAKHKKEKKPGLIKMVGVNISLSYTGLRAVSISVLHIFWSLKCLLDGHS